MPSAIEQAIALHQQGRWTDAERAYRDVLRTAPRDFEALHMLGILKLQQGESAEAERLIGAAIAIDQGSAAAYSNHGLALAALNRYQDALSSYDKALRISPGNVDALANRGDALCELGRHDDALASYDQALAIDRGHVPALVNRGVLLRDLGRVAEALAAYEAALAIAPDDVEAWNNRGVAFSDAGRLDDALKSYDRALALAPDYAEALLNRGGTLLSLRRPAEAITSYGRALVLRPDLPEALLGRSHGLYDLGRFAEALASYEQALSTKADLLDAAIGRARCLSKLDRYAEALAEYDRLYELSPDLPNLLGDLAYCRSVVCDWTGSATLTQKLTATAVDGASAVDPFMFLSFEGTEQQQLTCAQNWLRLKKVTGTDRKWTRDNFPGDKIRVAYLSADYHRHATSHLIAELFELHDRSRFEIVGISFGPDDHSPLRSRVIKSFDRFFDVASRSDEETAKLLRDLKVHIAVDLKGHTTDARIRIFADRAAPIQVSYLGYPGTTGAAFIDYIIADRVVLPFEQQPFYSECIVHLPDSYQINDSKRAIGERLPTRSEVGLPDNGFVFCCFNNTSKVNAAIFDVWMRLLRAVEGSVLWLYAPNSLAPVNLRLEAQTRGVDPARLVFAPPLDLPEHLARHKLADLFLDTLPYNAHTTASDSLWAGVPLVTCVGTTFAGRVAASLVHAAGLPDLAAKDLPDYESLALKLATDPERLREIRSRLDRRSPLFDANRFRHHIEAAYERMWEMWQRGEAPQPFSIEPIEGPL